MKKNYTNKAVKQNNIGYPGIKVGRLNARIAKTIGVPCADIFLSDNHKRHILNTHKVEMEQLGIGVLHYVIGIVGGFNQIRKGSGNSLLLVVFIKEASSHAVAAIDLCYQPKQDVWEIKTAEPRNTADVLKRKLLWQSCQHSK